MFSLQAWMEQDGTPLTDRTSCSVEVYDKTGALVTSLGPNTTPDAQGTFAFVYNTADAVFNRNQAYVAKVTITNGVTPKVSLASFTVF